MFKTMYVMSEERYCIRSLVNFIYLEIQSQKTLWGVRNGSGTDQNYGNLVGDRKYFYVGDSVLIFSLFFKL